MIGASLGAKASIISPYVVVIKPESNYLSNVSVQVPSRTITRSFTWCFALDLVSKQLSNFSRIGGTYIPHRRQITDAFGILLGFIAWKSIQSSGLGDDSHVETRWRLLTLTPLIPTIPLLLVAYMVPESYIFLMKTRNYRKAARSACQYRRTDIQGLRDLAASHFQMEAEGALMEKRKEATKQRKQAPTRKKTLPMSRYNTFDETRPLEERLREGPPGVCRDVGDGGECPHHYHMKEVHFFKRLWQVFADARCRRALISCGMAMLTQSVCGINAFAFYSSSLLDAGLSSSASANLSISFGIVNFCFGLLAPFLSDRLGRTTLLLGGLPFMSLFMFMLAGLIAPSNPARDATILVVSCGCIQ